MALRRDRAHHRFAGCIARGAGNGVPRLSEASNGRPAAGIRANDAAHAHLTLDVDSLQEILAAPG
jgi:hypothetical protein